DYYCAAWNESLSAYIF
nr:immunoglobulin light chain junction region [Macaca mulatta]